MPSRVIKTLGAHFQKTSYDLYLVTFMLENCNCQNKLNTEIFVTKIKKNVLQNPKLSIKELS
jgi:hypothetical protein